MMGYPIIKYLKSMSWFMLYAPCNTASYTVDGFIFVGTNFRGLNENDTFVGFKIRGHSIFLHNSYIKSLNRWYWNSWIEPSTKTTKIGTPRKLSHPQYKMRCERKVHQKEGSKNARFLGFYTFFIILRQKVYCLIELELTLNLLSIFSLFFLVLVTK